MGQHAVLSPSGYKALMLCPGKPAMEMGLADSSSEYADEGTAAHFLAAECLTTGKDAKAHVGHTIYVTADGAEFGPSWPYAGEAIPGRRFVVDQDMADAVQIYLNTVRDYQGDGTLFAEQALPIDHITGEAGAEGTGDAVIIRGDEIVVGDLKFGRGVEVSAEDNPQLKLYALGALRKFDLVGDLKSVRVFISQPRINPAPSEWTCTVEDLVKWGEGEARTAAVRANAAIECRIAGGDLVHYLKPAEDACRWCKAKAECPALAGYVKEALGAEFTDLTTADKVEQAAIVEANVTAHTLEALGPKMDAIPLIEDWCKAIRARVESELLAGRPVAGYKLVQGRKGSRAWADAEAVEKTLKSMRLKQDEMYTFTLISPTTAEKVLKDTPKRWARITPLITQADGKPSVAPITDKRPPLDIKPVESEFTPIPESAEAVLEAADDLV